MPILTLARLSLEKIPFEAIQFMDLKQKTVIHYELYPLVYTPKRLFDMQGRPRSLYTFCDCPNYGRCLCYLAIFRDEMVENFWTDPNKYVCLSGWIDDGN